MSGIDQQTGALILLGIFAVLVILSKLFGSTGPTDEMLAPFKVPEDGGALKRLNKDSEGRITVKLAKRTKISDDTYIFRYSLGDAEMTMGMAVGAHVAIHKPSGEVRKYTPISDILTPGVVDFVIKVYRPNPAIKDNPNGGVMSQFLESQKLGASLQISGPFPKITYQGFGKFKLETDPDTPVFKKRFGTIAGGTGITPGYNIFMHALTHKDKLECSLIQCNNTLDDILLKQEIQDLADTNADKFKVHHCIAKLPTKPKESDNVKYSAGYVTTAIIVATMPPPSDDTFITYCGPPPFQDAVLKSLKELGYDRSMYQRH